MPVLHACFDKDGTLTDVHSYWAHTCSIRADVLTRKFGGDPAALLDCMGISGGRIKPGGPVGYKPRPLIVAAVAAALGRADAEISAVFLEVDRRQQQSDDYKIDVLPGARETLAALKAKGLKLSVYTSDRVENARRALAATGMASFIDAVVGGDSVAKPKPHPEGLETACRLVGVPAADTAYVGDTLDDLQMAAAAGATAVGVGSGLCSLSELRAAAKVAVPGLAQWRP